MSSRGLLETVNIDDVKYIGSQFTVHGKTAPKDYWPFSPTFPKFKRPLKER